ncbi:MAG: alpha/beta hydrolase [Pseudomonadales bacterium]|nr:alpha/beta hydrolase [Pseudomonadales bacterium]
MKNQTRQGEAAEFRIFERRIAAKLWGDPRGQPTFALHGWLDNANTFDRLAPLLPELNLVALDFAGHGFSDHRPPGVHYHSFTDIQDVMAIAGELGWKQFNLLGHSMGASISSELAAMFPERIERSVLIDGFIATGGVTLQERIGQNREAIEKMLTAHNKSPRVYPDPRTMAERVTQATDQSFAAASVLVARGHKPVSGGVTWRTDPRIRFATPLRHTRETINFLLEGSIAPALLLVAEQGDKWYQGEIEEAQAHHPALTVERMPGPHHIHLEPDHVAAVAGHTRAFFGLD